MKGKLKGIKLLIIDDEAEFAATLCRRLRLRNIDAVDAYSGQEGLVRLTEVNPNIVILDLKMHDMSGLDVLEKIKASDASIEVIMLTGHGSIRAGIEAGEKGAFDYMIKPVDLPDLLGKINEAVKKQAEGNEGKT
ncbi:Response regulator receiver domain-containing protein [Candidatus Electrothrix marina]|uniref:Response regulator receiver domain-containing protein n=1 Tax=Candidatus Electrothrix marina TaxID=1859130 RepID=A0A444JCB2_9BACT|nr:Response regulator receiver domain-containing protein [Candidatus Electrothrix marina]RWX52185.1 Response regulator receiver domain-containing protein [Candidatus Electrothrix marina]